MTAPFCWHALVLPGQGSGAKGRMKPLGRLSEGLSIHELWLRMLENAYPTEKDASCSVGACECCLVGRAQVWESGNP